jgi:hypothetical protein
MFLRQSFNSFWNRLPSQILSSKDGKSQISIILSVKSHWDLSYLFIFLLFIFHIQGAFGYFEVTQDITRYTKATVFKKVRKRTRIAVRFSVVSPDRGGADTVRWERMSKYFRVLCGGFILTLV